MSCFEPVNEADSNVSYSRVIGASRTASRLPQSEAREFLSNNWPALWQFAPDRAGNNSSRYSGTSRLGRSGLVIS